MKLFERFRRVEKPPPRVFVLSLDGVPHDFIDQAARTKFMPNLSRLYTQGALCPLDSVLPTVSTVAWANYATGVNPGRHGIFGFVDRQPNPFQVLIPCSQDLKVATFWETLGRAGKRVIVINLPLTYPPKPVNGIMVGGFLSPAVERATFPVELAPRLLDLGYRIDADTALAADPPAFFQDLNEVLSRRFAAAFTLLEQEQWDFFQLHVMGTDRINHFYWECWQDEDDLITEGFSQFYRRLDEYLGELISSLPAGCQLLLMSDHGCCRAKGQVHLNRWLEENGYLLLGRDKRELKNLHRDSRAYSLVPGRIYVNLEGREERGSVGQGKPYEELRQELIHRLGGLEDPTSHQPLIKAVHRREDIYQGPQLALAPDLVVEPHDGWELKANLDGRALVEPPQLRGAHSRGGAFLLCKEPPAGGLSPSGTLLDMAPTILHLLGVEPPHGLEGGPLA